MCGIIGAVGQPFDPIESYLLLTHLLRETKRRGPHATGFYAVDLNNKALTHKLPVCSLQYVKGKTWKKIMLGTKLFIGHNRWTTHGSAQDNKNNHPFVEKNGSLALVHNGIVKAYYTHKKDYELESECDTEILIKTIAKEDTVIDGIKKIFSLFGPGGDFACQVIDQLEGNYYFFRDDGRPGKMIDARKITGQIYFCSEKEIWRDAIIKSGLLPKLGKLDVVDIDPYQIIKINGDTLKIDTTKVEKPNKVYHSSSYRTPYNGYNNNYNDRDWDDPRVEERINRSRTYIPENNYGIGANRHSSYQAPEATKFDMIETKNEKGLPRFIFIPKKKEEEKKVTQKEVEDKVYKDALLCAANNPADQWPGWEDDAFAAGIINLEELNKIKEESEDALDHTSDREQEYIRNLENWE